MDELPPELLAKVFSLLSPHELYAVTRLPVFSYLWEDLHYWRDWRRRSSSSELIEATSVLPPLVIENGIYSPPIYILTKYGRDDLIRLLHLCGE